MATADSVKAKIQGLIATANAKTGKSDTELTSAVNHLAEGYGSGSGGGSGIIDVTELPTENIDENAVYRVNGYAMANVYCCFGDTPSSILSFEETVKESNPYATVYYFVVDTLPENPQITDFATFSVVYVYINNNIPYLYGNAGDGNMWLDLATALMGAGVSLENKGFIENKNKIIEAGIYVTYKTNPVGMALNLDADLVYFRGEWLEAKGLFLSMPLLVKELTAEDFANTKYITNYMFYTWVNFNSEGAHGGGAISSQLEKVTIPAHIRTIGSNAFGQNKKLTNIVIEKGELNYIGERAFGSWVTEIHYGGTKEEWKAILKQNNWDLGTPNYTIYCTDGTIAKDGTET